MLISLQRQSFRLVITAQFRYLIKMWICFSTIVLPLFQDRKYFLVNIGDHGLLWLVERGRELQLLAITVLILQAS
jgi:hypothetical protein